MDLNLTDAEQQAGMTDAMKREAMNRGAAMCRDGVECHPTLDSDFMQSILDVTKDQVNNLPNLLAGAWKSGWISENVERNRGNRV